MPYDHKTIESKWQKRWAKEGTFVVSDKVKAEKKKYILDMFPYPSGAGLHVGHPEGYTATDIYSRYLRMKGYQVLHPMGWDAFGLPAENYAIKSGVHPQESTDNNIKIFTRQIKSLGFSYDWTRAVNTSSPDYYKWTQWLFLQLYKNGLAYKKAAPVNWCPDCQTVLANEQVIDGKCERCGTAVIQKNLEQWFFKITGESSEVRGSRFETKKGTVLIIHGLAGHSQENWFPWLKEQLEVRGYEVLVPDMPNADDPTPGKWLQALKKYTSKLNQDSIIVAHSLGAVAAFQFIDKYNLPLNKLILVGPAHADMNWQGTEEVLGKKSADKAKVFCQSVIDFNRIQSLVGKIVFYFSKDDPYIPLDVKDQYARMLTGDFIIFDNKGHFNERAGITQFPEILKHFSTVDGSSYPERLLNNLDQLDWPEPIKTMQRNWIGRSEGLEEYWQVENMDLKLATFTTWPHTTYGATFMVVAPEHSVIDTLVQGTDYEAGAREFIKKVQQQKVADRTDVNKAKEGYFTGRYAINHLTGWKMPIYIANFAVMEYGTGIVKCCPAHDQRDFEFAKKYGLDIVVVVRPPDKNLSVKDLKSAYIDRGVMVNASKFNGMDDMKAKEAIADYIVERGNGKRVINYKLRDWLISRQRYWGAPIPIIYCDDCGEQAVLEKDLPVELPTDVDFRPTGESPLARSKSFHKVKCPKCGKPARRESDTMDTFVDSSWYWLRYTDPNNKKEFANKKKIQAWLPVDTYVGGAEHAVMHLMYARFIYMVLHDLGFLDFSAKGGSASGGDEPFLQLRNQGLILGPDGQKMSKSRGNVINPDDVIERLGADTMRMYEMFMGPLEDAKPWDTNGIVGVRRFLERVWGLQKVSSNKYQVKNKESTVERELHRLIKKIGEDIESFDFNTAVSQFMIFVNAVYKVGEISKEHWETFLKVLSPFAPHLANELWEKLGHKKLIEHEIWPEYDESLLVEDTITYVVQVNGKVRAQITAASDATEDEVAALASADEKVSKYLEGKEMVKTIFVKGRLINFVTK